MLLNENVSAFAPVTKISKKKKRVNYKLLLLALPFIVWIVIFSYVPILGWLVAFFDYSPGVSLFNTRFVGLYWFKMIFSEWRDLANALTNTFGLSGIGLLFSPLAMILAILLNEIKAQRYKKLVQSLTTIPNFISWVLVFSIFATFLKGEDAFVYVLLSRLQLASEPLTILENPKIAWLVQNLIGQWKSVGFSAIIYMAAISGISQELYDSAKVDGAGRFSIMRHITLPGLLPTFFVLFLLSIAGMLNNGIEQVYVFMNPLVADKLEHLDYYVFRIGIYLNSYSYSIAIGMFKSIVSIVLLFTANKVAKLIRGESIF